MSQRKQITIEDILRSPTSAADLGRTGRQLLEEVPQPGRKALRLAVLTLGEVASQIGVALVGKAILDGALAPTPTLDGRLIAVAFALALVGYGFVRARQLAQEEIALECQRLGVQRLSHNINRARYEDLAAVPMAALREIIMTDVNFAYRFFVDSLGQTVVVGFWSVAVLLLLAWLSPWLLVLAGALGVLFGLALVWGVRKHMTLTGERFARLADLSQRAREVVEVERIVLARQFGIDDFFVRVFMQAHEKFMAVSLLQGRLKAGVRSSILTMNSVAFLALVCLGGLLILGGGLSAGGLLAALFVVGQLLAALSQMGEYAARAAETATGGKRIAAYWNAQDRATRLDAVPEPSGDGAPSADAEPGRIETVTAEGVSFHYGSGPPVLDAVGVTLRRGEITALTAETGAGKSTLALILAGLLDPDAGRVFVNGEPRWTPERLAPGRVLYVPSKPILVEGSVQQNLFLEDGAPLPDRELKRFFDGITRGGQAFPVTEPIIGPNGLGVSSGQAQLIQLTRAVLRDPDVVIFDEATSSLDMATEAKVQRDLLAWCRERVCLVISHRRCPWTEEAAVHLTL